MFDKLFATYNFANAKDRKLLESLFEMYMSDIPDNFYENQFSLAKKYPGTQYADWVRILKHPAFGSWKAEQITIIATASTDKALAGQGDDGRDTLNLLKMRQDVLNQEKKTEKPTIIVIPEDLFFREDP
ncbi:MAG: hypothetical protein J6R62_06640 [Rikenellaceae bacterium]|nr:hypothetical protein [Rikenellaceae bacterium]